MEKAAVVNYVRMVKKLFVVFSCIMLPLIMVSLIFAFHKSIFFCILAPVLILTYLVIYALYALRVSMSVVLGVEITEQVIHIKTKRKTFTFDAKAGCVAMCAKKTKFIGTFRTQNSEEKFIFLRRIPMQRGYQEAFSAEEIKRIFPAFDEYES